MTSQCNLNGRWLGFQQSAAVPRVRQVRYRVSMGNCYGLLPLQRIQKPSDPHDLGNLQGRGPLTSGWSALWTCCE